MYYSRGMVQRPVITVDMKVGVRIDINIVEINTSGSKNEKFLEAVLIKLNTQSISSWGNVSEEMLAVKKMLPTES